MTNALAHAIKRVAELPDEEQEFFAALLSAELERLPVPDWHLEVLQEREAAIARDPTAVVTLEQLMVDLRERAKR